MSPCLGRPRQALTDQQHSVWVTCSPKEGREVGSSGGRVKLGRVPGYCASGLWFWLEGLSTGLWFWLEGPSEKLGCVSTAGVPVVHV